MRRRPRRDLAAETLRALAAVFAAKSPSLPTVTRTRRFVNGRGQLLECPGSLGRETIAGLLGLRSAPAANAAIGALLAEPTLVKNVHHCENDGGRAYIQALDLDVAALWRYLVEPLLARYISLCGMGELSARQWDDMTRPILAALRGDAVTRTITTPLLGVRLESPLRLAPHLQVRPATEDERSEWSEDAGFERSIARDILVAETVVEATYTSPWGPYRHAIGGGINVSTFTAHGVRAALTDSSTTVAVLRLVTGWALPLVFTEERIVSVPWARNRFFHRPTAQDTSRRFDSSPLWASVVWPEPLVADSVRRVVATWEALERAASAGPDLLRAVRLFLHERDYVNLYRVFELVQSHTGRSMRRWASQAEMDRFARTANSPDAVGDAWARHGRRISAPAHPVPLAEADSLVRRLLLGWIESLTEGPA